MAQTDATGLHVPDAAFEPSPELAELLARLSSTQAGGVIRIAHAELAGQSIESLFEGAGKVCARTTYYRKRGWVHNPKFQAALEQARREIRKLHLAGAVNDALEELKLTTPLAARDLRRQIAGDEAVIDALSAIAADRQKKREERVAAIDSLAQVGTPRATSALLALLHDPEVRLNAIRAIGPAAAGANGPRRLADVAVLDRADKSTASKGAPPVDPFDGYGDDELDQIIENLKIAIGAGDAVQGKPEDGPGRTDGAAGVDDPLSPDAHSGPAV